MILGISIDENFVYVSSDESKEVLSFPFAVGRNLANKSWFIGDETKNENVDNVDIVIDKLYYIVESDGNARIGEEKFTAKELVRIFFNNLFLKFEKVDYVTVVVRKNNVKLLSKIKSALLQKFDRDESKFKITTYSEAFLAYLRNQEPKYYNGTVALFDFTEKAITYYELVRYRANGNKEYWQVITKNYLALPLDLLSGEAGKKVCDNLLCEFAKKCIKSETYTNIILSGLGFKDSSLYRDFMTLVCTIANVNTDINFFAKSAVLLSQIILNNEEANIIPMTDARTTASIKLYATHNGESKKINLIEPGEEWFDICDYSFLIILDGSREITFEIVKVIEGVIRNEVIAIPDYMSERLDKTVELEVRIIFIQQNLMQIEVVDKGFGDFFEATKNGKTEKTVEI